MNSPERFEEEEEYQPPVTSYWTNFKINVYLQFITFSHREMYKTLIFFILVGFIVPRINDIDFNFLIRTCNFSREQYDFLNICESVGVIIGTILYLKILRHY